MVFSKEGIEPDPKKVHALTKMAHPTSVEEVQSLLGMTNVLTSFIPDYSTITAPIRKLTQKEQAFEWELKQQSAFDRLKDILSSAPVVKYFD